jgi:hypothetical protein
MVPAVTAGQFRVVSRSAAGRLCGRRSAGRRKHLRLRLDRCGETPDLLEWFVRSGSATIEGTAKDARAKPWRTRLLCSCRRIEAGKPLVVQESPRIKAVISPSEVLRPELTAVRVATCSGGGITTRDSFAVIRTGPRGVREPAIYWSPADLNGIPAEAR